MMDDPDLYSLPGYRFSPTDEELIECYLKPKITGNDNKNTRRIREVNINKYEPWDLPRFARIPTKDKVWYYFTEQSLKHKKGNSKNRSTEKGYWKPTGTDRKIMSGGKVIGMKKTLVYHTGRSPGGEGTKYVLHEYRTVEKQFDGKQTGQKAFVLYRLFDNREKSTKGGPAVSLDTLSCIEETKYKSSLAPVSPALEVLAETHQTKKQEAEMTSSEDGFNVEEYFNKFSPPTFDFNVDEMMSDATAPVQFKNDDFNSEVGFNVEEYLNKFCCTPPEDSPSSLPPIAPDVSTPIGSKSSYEETQSEPTLAQASHALLEQAEKHLANGRTRFDIVAPLACNNGYNVYASGGHVAEVKATEVRKDFTFSIDQDLEKIPKMFYPLPPEPLDCNFSSVSTTTTATPAVTSPTTAKASLEEAQSMLAPASVSPKLGSEAANYPMSFRCCTEENSDGITSCSIPAIEYNGYSTYDAKNDAVEITSDEVEADWNMFPVTPQPLGCNMLSPSRSQMQADLGSSCISYPFTNDLNSGHWGVHLQSFTNESAPNISESWDMTPCNSDDCFRYESSSQNYLSFDDENRENMVSVKDNGSRCMSDAVAQFELEYQYLLWPEEIINPKVSPGLLKSGSYLGSLGGSSDQIIGSD